MDGGIKKLANPRICLIAFSDFTDDIGVNQIHEMHWCRR